MRSLFIRHKKFLDVCIEVDQIQGNKVTGRYWNMGQTAPYEMGARANVTIECIEDWLINTVPNRNDGDWQELDVKDLP